MDTSLTDSPRSSELRVHALTVALLLPLVLVLAELVLRRTHHRPLGAVTVAAGATALAFSLRVLVRGLVPAYRSQARRDSLSQIETDDAPAISGVMSRRGSTDREPLLMGAALILWALSFAWVFFG